MTRIWLPILPALALIACGLTHGQKKLGKIDWPDMQMVHAGQDRATLRYQETFPAGKRALFSQINLERQKEGLSPLKYDTRGARVGDDFCADSARNDTSGHWDLAGRAPYLRWGLGGGVDFHAQNFALLSRIPGPITESVESLLLSAHGRMMAELPPDDGHRRTVLNPVWTHVGIGAALLGGEFRMTEEYSRQVMEWVEIPAQPVPAGKPALFAARLPPKWNLAFVELGFEPFPSPLTREEVRNRGGYGYPPSVHRSRVSIDGSQYHYTDGTKGEIEVVNGTFRMLVPLKMGPGNYYVHVFGGEGNIWGVPLTPLTGALIQAK